MSNELNTPRILYCETDSRKYATNFSLLRRENISYFLTMDAPITSANAIIAGDRNLVVAGRPATPGLCTLASNSLVTWTKQMHSADRKHPRGNMLFADGHVDLVTTANPAVQRQGLATNRLAMP
jgi:prepilin-type processing-associated H-X9-DG protein